MSIVYNEQRSMITKPEDVTKISISSGNASLFQISEYRNLKELYIEDSSNFQFQELMKCTELRSLILKKTDITDEQLSVISKLPKLVKMEIDDASNLTSLSGIKNMATNQALHHLINNKDYLDVLSQLKYLIKQTTNSEWSDIELHPFLQKTQFADIQKVIKYIKMGTRTFDKIITYYGNLYEMLKKEKPVKNISMEIVVNTLIKETLEEALEETTKIPSEVIKNLFVEMITTVWELGNKKLSKEIRELINYKHTTLFYETLYEIKHASDEEYSFQKWYENKYRKETLEYAKSGADNKQIIQLQIPQMHSIVINKMNTKSVDGFSEFSKMPELNDVTLTNCDLDDSHLIFGHLPNCSSLNLSNNKICNTSSFIGALGKSQKGKEILFALDDFRKLVMFGFLIMLAEEYDPLTVDRLLSIEFTL